MGIVLTFADRHARASTGSARRAPGSNAIIMSGVMPADTATAAAKTVDHHSDGMLSRCHHLLTWDGVAPTSAAQASRVGQSSMIERNEAIFAMPDLLGQSVLKGKVKVSHDCGIRVGHSLRMVSSDSGTLYKTAFLARVRKAREDRRMTQNQAAELLGIKQDKYKQYETRSLMPHELIPKFCLIFAVSFEWLLTGKTSATIKKAEFDKVRPRKTATG